MEWELAVCLLGSVFVGKWSGKGRGLFEGWENDGVFCGGKTVAFHQICGCPDGRRMVTFLQDGWLLCPVLEKEEKRGG